MLKLVLVSGNLVVACQRVVYADNARHGREPPTNAVRLVPIAVLDEGEGPSLSTLPRTAVLPLLGERARLRQEPIEHFGLFILNILGSNFDFPTLSLFRASKMPLTVRAAPQGRLSFFFLLQDLGLGWPRGGRWRAAPDGPSPPSLQKPPRGGVAAGAAETAGDD